MTSEMETNIVAVERVKEYAETPQEVYLLYCGWKPLRKRFGGKDGTNISWIACSTVKMVPFNKNWGKRNYYFSPLK